MMWPFRKTEHRAAYTDAVVQAIVNQAAGGTAASALQVGALESCVGLVGRAFASGKVNASATVRDALTPSTLALIGRELIRRGDLVLYIDVDDVGKLTLLPCNSVEIKGGPDAASWTYLLELAGPSRGKKVRAAADGVIHIRYASDPVTPWRGVGPLQVAALAGRLSAETTKALADEASGPTGNLLPIPSDGADETVTLLRTDIGKARGQTLLVESGDWGNVGGAPATAAGWDSKRLGAEPPASLVALQQQSSNQIFAAVGLSPVLFNASAAGSSLREAWRQTLFYVLKPLGRLVEAELSRKLETAVEIDFSALAGSDLQVKSRSVNSLVSAGVDVERALQIAGIE